MLHLNHSCCIISRYYIGLSEIPRVQKQQLFMLNTIWKCCYLAINGCTFVVSKKIISAIPMKTVVTCVCYCRLKWNQMIIVLFMNHSRYLSNNRKKNCVFFVIKTDTECIDNYAHNKFFLLFKNNNKILSLHMSKIKIQ